MTKQILATIKFCHGQNVCHRDLKPENIIFDKRNRGSIKVIDFGAAHHFSQANNRMRAVRGTPMYNAPEVTDESSEGYTSMCDMWSIGVILYVMLYGIPPFSGSNHEISQKVRTEPLPLVFEDEPPVSDLAKDLIKKLITKVDTRLDAE